MANSEILIVPLADAPPMPDEAFLKIAAHGAELHISKDADSAKQLIKKLKNLKIIVLNQPHHELYSFARKAAPQARLALLTDMAMHAYSEALRGEEELLVDHIIANRNLSEWTLHEFRVTLQKVLRADIFGMEKYLAPNTHITSKLISTSEEREANNTAVMVYAEKCLLGAHASKMLFGVTEELQMNALYDAPYAAGIIKDHDSADRKHIQLKAHESPTLSYACDGRTFAVGISDPFGRLTQEKFFQYLKKVLARRDSSSIIDTKKGGAGLGLFKILYSCHSLVCNVSPEKNTEIIVLLDMNEHLRDFTKMARSIHYFTV